MICTNYSTFRWIFTIRVEKTGVSLQFNNLNPDTISRVAGSFVTDGVQANMVFEPSLTVNNNTQYEVDVVAGTILTLDPAEAVTAEGPVVANYQAYWLANDGFAIWPGPEAVSITGANYVRAGGFTGGITGFPSVYTMTSVLELTCNGGASDSVPGTDEFDWYVSQRSDDTADQMFTVSTVANKSGSIRLVSNALATAEFPAVTVCTPEVTSLLFRDVHVYVQRRSDKSIQWLNLGEAMS